MAASTLTAEINDAKLYISAIEWLRANKADVIRELKKPERREADWDTFQYPHYWGMPQKISSRLYGDMVERIAELTYEWWPYER